MPLLEAEAAKLSNNNLIRGVVQEIIDADEVFQFLPFVRSSGKAYLYNRENTLAQSQFITTNVDVPESASSFTEVTVTLRIIAGDVDVDNFLDETQGDTNDQKTIQIAMKAKSTARLFSNKLINGDASTAYNLAALGGAASVTNIEFDGLDRLCSASQKLEVGSGSGSALTFEMLDQLLDYVKLGAQAIIMSRREIRSLQKLWRALGGVVPQWVQQGNGKSFLAHSNVPILMNDYISTAQVVGGSSDCGVVYAIRMNELDGVHGVYGGNEAGIRFTDIGQLQHRDATRARLKWYVTMAIKSTKSLARLTGVRSA